MASFANTLMNRYLDNEVMDDIDHALGRPKAPMRETYRDHFECPNEAEAKTEDEAITAWNTRTGDGCE